MGSRSGVNHNKIGSHQHYSRQNPLYTHSVGEPPIGMQFCSSSRFRTRAPRYDYAPRGCSVPTVS